MQDTLSIAGDDSDSTLTMEALDQAFAGTLEPVPLTPGYRVGLLLVAVATVLLPLIYIGLIGAVSYLVYLHAVSNTHILSGRGAGMWRLLLYLSPVIIGALLVLFMIKPLFARPARGPDPMVLDPARFPLLFAFVEHIRLAVGAPAPSEIRVDCDVNASAGLRRGLLSLGRQDLVLTIGLPLISGMSLRQLAGVLAHEFGHFAQGSGMALTYLVRSVNGWLYRVVYTRDEWDEKLARASADWDLRLGVVLLLARFFIWMTRKVLWVLMMVGHAIGTFMLRHMEFDADRYEARLAGSETFAETALRMRVLSVGSQKAIGWLSDSWTERRLVDDYASLVAASADALPSELLLHLGQADAEPDRSVFDTHPPDSERIASARRENAPGIFQLELPARAAVAGYHALAREATRAFYQGEQGIDVGAGQLVPLRKFVAEQGEKDEADRVAASYLHGIGSLGAPLPLPADGPRAAPSLARALQQAHEAREVAAEMAKRLPDASDGAEEGAVDDARAPTNEPDPALLRAVAESVATRLASGLSLLLSEDLSGRLPDAEARRAEAARLYEVLSALGQQKLHVEKVLQSLDTALSRVQAHRENDADAGAYSSALAALSALHSATTSFTEALPDLPYPFEHAAGQTTLRQFATEDLAQLGDVHDGALARCQTVMQRMFLLYQRVLARLAVIAQGAEQAAEAEAPQGS